MSERNKSLLTLAVAVVLGGIATRILLPMSPAQAQNPAPIVAGMQSSNQWVLLHHDTGAGHTIPLWVNLEQADSIRFEEPTPISAKPKANVVLARQIAVVFDPQEIELLRRYVQEHQRK